MTDDPLGRRIDGLDEPPEGDAQPLQPEPVAPVEADHGVATQRVAPRRSLARPQVRFRSRLRDAFAGLSAVGVKELRGRMRGRRAFVILTVYLVLLAAFGWMMELIIEQEQSQRSGSGAAYASATIGRGVFSALMMLETLLVVALAPAFTAGAISMEREKQTLDMLAATPISSLAIVIGKLLSALTYVFILIGASIPLTAMVFVFGGVGPDEVVRGYIILLVSAVGLGSVGLFISALMQRTQAATVVTFFGVMALTMGTLFIVLFWTTMAGLSTNQLGGRGQGLGPINGRPPDALLWFNPFAAQYDVICGASDGYGGWCSRLAEMTKGAISIGIGGGATGGSVFEPGIVEPALPIDGAGRLPALERGVVNDVAVQPFGIRRDVFWPRSVAAWMGLSAVLVVASVQLVSPTRRWRPPFLNRPSRRPS